MSPSETLAAYRRALAQDHEVVTLVRLPVNGATRIESRPVLARVTGYRPQEMVAGIVQGDQRVILLAEDLEASGFPDRLVPGGPHRVAVRGRELAIKGIDDTTRRVAGVLIAYEVHVKG